MARRSKASFEKRAREKKKAEKAAQKRDARLQRSDEGRKGSPPVATADDLAGYGLASDDAGAADAAEDDPDPAHCAPASDVRPCSSVDRSSTDLPFSDTSRSRDA